MAEFVQEAVDKLQQDLSQIKCLNQEERRIIVKKVTRLEYKTRKRTKNKHDCITFITYLKDLLALLKARKGTAPMTKVCLPFILKIHELYQLHQNRFPDDINAYLDHATFCKEQKERKRASRILKKLLAFHGHVPELWVVAALMEMDHHDFESARALMQRCVSMNTGSHVAWVEFYRLELQIARFDPEPDCAVAELVCQNALEEMPENLDLLLDMIDISSGFKFCQKQTEALLKKLQEEFAHFPLVWDYRARLLLPERKKKLMKLSFENEKRFVALYEQGVTEMPTKEMWSLYAKACIGMTAVTPDDESRFKHRLKQTLEVLRRAADKNLLEHDMFLVWVKLVQNVLQDASGVKEICELMLQHFPVSPTSWKLLLSIKFHSLAPAIDVTSCLEKALLKVAEKESWCLWEGVLQYLDSVSSDLLEPLLQTACGRLTIEVCMPAKLMYLQWTALNKNIKATRALYKKLSVIKPVPLPFFLQYAKQELLQEKVKIKKVRRAYEDAISDYGKTEPDLWLQYIHMELSESGGNPAQAGNLHYRAMLNLSNDDLKHSFLQTYDLVVCQTMI